MRQGVARAVGRVVCITAWVAVCLFQVALVGSRLRSQPEPGTAHLILTAGLVYWPVGLAAATVWLTRKRSTCSKVMAHIAALYLSVAMWFPPF